MDKNKKFYGPILCPRCASLTFLLKDGGEPEAFRWLLASDPAGHSHIGPGAPWTPPCGLPALGHSLSLLRSDFPFRVCAWRGSSKSLRS